MDNQLILMIEDEQTLIETVQYNLTRNGYQVLAAMDGQKGIDLARQHQPALIILDLMLPTFDGFEVCRILRREMNCPILILTARTDEIDKIVGLEVGADDYLTKPFSMRELVVRIKAQLRRVRLVREEVSNQQKSLSASKNSGERITLGTLVIDTGRHEVLLSNKVLHLKPKEYDLLLFLVRNRGIVLSRELILERVWGWEFDGGSRSVDVHIRWLREKIELNPTEPIRIVTVRGTGYRFEG